MEYVMNEVWRCETKVQLSVEALWYSMQTKSREEMI